MSIRVANATRDIRVRVKIDLMIGDLPGARPCPRGEILFVDAGDVVPAGKCAVVVFARPEGDLLDAAIRVGARGLIMADDPVEDFRRAVRDVAGGGGWISPRLSRPLLARVPRGVTTLPESLTARELQTLKLLVKGRENAEIAATMFVSVSGVKYHVSNILRKFGCRDRTQLVALLGSIQL